MVEIIRVEAVETAHYMEELIGILQDAVENGASIGFMLPLEKAEAQAFWKTIFAEVANGQRVLLAAVEDGKLRGTAQLGLATKPNALHRAEVQKVIVHTRARRRGIGTALMRAVEDQARQLNRTLLVLDTRQGDPAEQLYQRHGFVQVGVIPDYARSPEGQLEACVFYYRRLA